MGGGHLGNKSRVSGADIGSTQPLFREGTFTKGHLQDSL